MKKLLITLVLLLFPLTARATDIQEVTSPNGITAWLVEDHKLPLISLQFAFRGGVEEDPADRQGLAHLTMNLLTEGAGPYDATQFQQRLEDRSISLGFSAGRDALGGNLKLLSDDRDTGFEMLHLALTQARFDQADIDRLKAAQLTSLRHQLANPGWQARYALFQDIFAGHPYSERSLGSTHTLEAITRDDITGFAAAHLARDNLVVAVAGDITPDQLKQVLDKTFGDLPPHAQLARMSDVTWPKKPATILVPRNGTQTELLFAMPGPKREDDDWYAAEIANYALGGGGFQSRLMHDVREEKGLTYGIDMDLSGMEHAGAFVGDAATDNDKTAEAWAIAQATMRKFHDEGITPTETQAAKDYLTGALPLTLTSTNSIASALVQIQLDHLGIDYLDRRNDLIRNVSAADLQRVIQKWFDPANLTLVMVGKPEGVQPDLTKDLMRE